MEHAVLQLADFLSEKTDFGDLTTCRSLSLRCRQVFIRRHSSALERSSLDGLDIGTRLLAGRPLRFGPMMLASLAQRIARVVEEDRIFFFLLRDSGQMLQCALRFGNNLLFFGQFFQISVVQTLEGNKGF